MSGAISIGGIMTAVGTAVAGAVVSKALMPKQQNAAAATPTTAPAPQAPPQSQAAQAPDQQAQRAARAGQGTGGGGGPGAAGTMLTGASGIDPTTLNLGKNTLLGQ